MLLDENKPLAPFTTFGLGGPARWFVEAHTETDIVEAADWARSHSIPLFVLGGGSNLLVADQGYGGLVLHIALRGIETLEFDSESTLFRVAAGEDWDPFVQRTVDAHCAGIECLAGIPGTVGGTPVQNVGAYGQEVASVIVRVRAYDLSSRTCVELPAADCAFAYRRSRFNSEDRGRFIVIGVWFRLQRGGAPTLRYTDLQRAFSPESQPTLSEVAAEVRRIRASKGMLLVDGDPNCRSAGSFFKNPIVTAEHAARIASLAGVEPPHFPTGSSSPGGSVKVPAAWLIEQAGFRKGYVFGPAGLSSRHTLALINRGNATAADILALAEQIQSAVHDRFGVSLEREPVLLGF
jgi:UDP-N-acetylmuramate dehydrogenase